MITLERASYQDAPRYAEYCGLQSDEKPTNAKNGDEFQEIDTGKKWKYDATSETWIVQPTSGSGIETGVATFNGRIGTVVPLAGDYTAEMVGAVDSTEKGMPNGVATLNEDGKITTEQIPSLNYDPLGAAQTIQNNLNTHISNFDNPHQTTAEQVGAIAKDGSTITTASIPFAQGIDLKNQKAVNMASPTQLTDGANKQYVDTEITDAIEEARIRPRQNDLYAIQPGKTGTYLLPVSKENVMVVFYSIAPDGSVNVANSKAIVVNKGESQTRDKMTVRLSADGLTVTLQSTETTNILAGQYYTFDNT